MTKQAVSAVFLVVAACAVPCAAQVTPAAGYTPPDDTPAIKVGVTMFLDYTVDRLTPNKTLPDQKKSRSIAGVAYWFPHQGNVSTALLFDVDTTKFDSFSPAQATQRKIAVHALVNF